MRVTNAHMTALMQSNMNRSSEALAKLSVQIASGDRLTRPSDDPIAAVRLMRIKREEADLAQYGKNIGNVASGLAMQEEHLDSLAEAMTAINDLVLSAANGTRSREDLVGIASQLQGLEQSVTAFINAQDGEGNYFFSGTKNRSAAVTLDPVTNRYVLGGNASVRHTPVAYGVEMPTNVTAVDFLGTNADFLNDLHALVTTLQSPTLDPSDPALTAQFGNMLTEFNESHLSVLGAMTDVGGWQSTLSLLNDTNADLSLANKKAQGDLSNLDMAEATMDLNSYQISIQASQKTYMKIHDLSLFSIL